jgi:hypothetical protein
MFAAFFTRLTADGRWRDRRARVAGSQARTPEAKAAKTTAAATACLARWATGWIATSVARYIDEVYTITAIEIGSTQASCVASLGAVFVIAAVAVFYFWAVDLRRLWSAKRLAS